VSVKYSTNNLQPKLIYSMTPDTLLNIGHAAKILDLTTRRVRQLCDSGLMAYTTTPGKHRRFTMREICRMKRLLKKYRQWGLLH
jgi:hypothetical protein